VLSQAEATQIGEKIFFNECAGKEALLTSWNRGEAFPSLGIGHFIWYPTGTSGPFKESFPELIRYMQASDANIPDWIVEAIEHGAPWPSRTLFLNAQDSARMQQLRDFLAETKHLQTKFMVKRLNRALPTMLATVSGSQKAKIEQQFQRVASAPMGYYALIDYVNFKGEGVKTSERYQDQGWGLLQVLEVMDESKPPLAAFAEAAKKVLARRVANSPAERNEQRWLPGWYKRISTYIAK